MIRYQSPERYANRLYYRYTCEQCGFHSHWMMQYFRDLPSCAEVGFGPGSEPGSPVPYHFKRLDIMLQHILEGRRAVRRTDSLVYDVLARARKCPKCGHQQSWFPVQRLFTFSANRYNRKHPMLSEPDIVFCGNSPQEEFDLLEKPCSITVVHHAEASEANEPGTYLCINEMTKGKAYGSFYYTQDTRFGDNVITVRSLSGIVVLTYYFRAESGAGIKIYYEHFKFEITAVFPPDSSEQG